MTLRHPLRGCPILVVLLHAPILGMMSSRPSRGKEALYPEAEVIWEDTWKGYVEPGLPRRVAMTTKKWSDIRSQKFMPSELREIDREIEDELLKIGRIKLTEG